MSRTRKKIKQSKANEKERLARKNSPDGELPVYDPRTRKKKGRAKDSYGKKIPKESERAEERKAAKEEKEKLQSQEMVKEQAQTKAEEAVAQIKFTRDKKYVYQKPKVKVKKVLSKEAKKLLATWISIAATIIIAVVIIIIVALNISNASKNTDENKTLEEKAMLMGTVTKTGRQLFESTHKFDGFWTDESGIEYDRLYDTMITIDDANTLKKYGQYPNEEGIIPYNKERAITDRENLSVEDKTPNDEGAPSPSKS